MADQRASNRVEHIIGARRIRSEDVEIPIEPALEVRALGELELGIRRLFLLGPESVEGFRRAAGENKHAFSERVRDLVFLKSAVLHRRQQKLQPRVVL